MESSKFWEELSYVRVAWRYQTALSCKAAVRKWVCQLARRKGRLIYRLFSSPGHSVAQRRVPIGSLRPHANKVTPTRTCPVWCFCVPIHQWLQEFQNSAQIISQQIGEASQISFFDSLSSQKVFGQSLISTSDTRPQNTPAHTTTSIIPSLCWS